jgi:hypothetical protein
MKKVIAFLFVSCLMCMSSFGEDIILQPEEGGNGTGQGRPKSPAAQVLAALEENVLYLSFAPSASSEVIITDSQTDTVVYSNTFGVAAGQVIPLTTFPAGEYELSIYAFGQWWEGVFEIE